MDIAISGRHTKVADDLRERITEKMEKVEALAPRATRVDVHVVHERNPKRADDQERVEITVRGKGGVVRAEASAADRHAAFDAASARLLEQLRRLHERRAHRHQGTSALRSVGADAPLAPVADSGAPHAASSVEPWEGAPEGATREVPIDGTPIVIRSKTHAAVPITVSEAIDQMELVGHDFYLFLDAESGLPSAVYRRRGWTYGVIHLSEQDSAESVERETA
ncbi:ribosome-associated translation inhibitor RaiA [Demequina capsici]|uniref:Ribosome hibernation promoting factor n=1 Tax=Demequina capsici TaxID=3075620 RepID=A0AA96JCQ2_9MICO|nr:MULTISPECIES: ribosome-associated translation inhibitor RaiA [unclassified Demequina]WNM23864.1 ribosome-associated translation inhibitor RaiA [Demequina sp. OYTSA14]WNM26703.1 ribosome-associated translation inhibitor RaiA [Demequina sp. PMTSA13]